MVSSGVWGATVQSVVTCKLSASSFANLQYHIFCIGGKYHYVLPIYKHLISSKHTQMHYLGS